MKYTIDSAEKDLDKLVSFGVYSVKSPVHAPSGVTDWANVFVVPTNGSNVYVAQILVTHGGRHLLARQGRRGLGHLEGLEARSRINLTPPTNRIDRPI